MQQRKNAEKKISKVSLSYQVTSSDINVIGVLEDKWSGQKKYFKNTGRMFSKFSDNCKLKGLICSKDTK